MTRSVIYIELILNHLLCSQFYQVSDIFLLFVGMKYIVKYASNYPKIHQKARMLAVGF